MNPPHLTRSLLLCSLAVLAASCSSAGTAAPPPQTIVGDWTLVQIVGGEESSLGSEETRNPTMIVNATGIVNGFAGVNQYGSSLAVEALNRGGFSLGSITATRMAGPPETMALETRFLGSLLEASAYRLEGDTLVLANESGDLLRFTRE